MIWTPFHRRHPPPDHDESAIEDAQQALDKAKRRWGQVHRTVRSHHRLQVENHLGQRVADTFRDKR